MECGACRSWIKPLVDREAREARCPECGHVEAFETFPLFILTGTSGTGKSAVIPELRRLLPEWEVFETDILWDSGGDWRFVQCNWLRIAYSIALHSRPTLLCGTILPENLEDCDSRHLFHRIYYLALDCDDQTRDERLRSRPQWRRASDEMLLEYRKCARWILEHAAEAFDPPLHVVDTTHASIVETARQIQAWASGHWMRERKS